MLNRIRKMREKKGFTLVELIVVIAIIAILTAVIVPLVGRYSAQATYTTLQDTAKTIQTSTINVISDVTMMGKIYEDKVIIGKKDATNGLVIEIYDKSATPKKLAEGKSAGASKTSDGTDEDKDVAEKVYNALADALTGNCNFAELVGTNTVEGTVYTTASTAFAAADIKGFSASTSVEKDPDFNEAYKVKAAIGSVAAGTQIGVAGSFIPA